MFTRRISRRFVFAAALAMTATTAGAETPSGPLTIDAAYQAILASTMVTKTLADIKADDDAAFAEQKRITEIPAPPFKESARADFI